MNASTTKAKWQLAEELAEQAEREGHIPQPVVTEIVRAVESREPSQLVALIASFWRDANTGISAHSPLSKATNRAAAFNPPAPTVPPAITGAYPDSSLWLDADWPDKLVQQGALVSATVFRDAMSWSRQALSKALNEHRVFYVSRGSKRLYPTFFVSTTYDTAQVQATSRALGGLPGESKMLFFTAPKLSLNQESPLQLLAKGQLEPVLKAAHAFAER
ncbi:MAG: hypothetical protein AB8C46_23995 [Burkholderiaceae bacterium]